VTLGLYLHVPFCSVRCSYCDFYLVAGRRPATERFVDALRREIAAAGPRLAGRPVDTIHFGGGTPSLLPADGLASILAAIRSSFRVADGAEIALEANPEDLDRPRLERLASTGVNRIAIGVQSLDDRCLRAMRRVHTARQALEALAAARQAGIPSVAADLMLGLPGQGAGAALDGIGRVIGAGADHVSIYLLEVHPRTRLGRAIALGRTAPMGDDETAGLYGEAAARLEAADLGQYEISNFARPGHRSRHNLRYWTDGEYLGLGPSAHSYMDGRRWRNAADLRAYLEAGGAGCPRRAEPGGPAARGAEALCAGLRLVDGVDLVRLRERYGDAIPAPDDPRIDPLREAGLLRADAGRLAFTPRGRLLSNEVLARLIPAPAPEAPFN
jgi:oxygen-independent coproporphyrinogen-3 oxidase